MVTHILENTHMNIIYIYISQLSVGPKIGQYGNPYIDHVI